MHETNGSVKSLGLSLLSHWQHQHCYSGRRIARAIHALGRFAKIFFLRRGDVHEGLRVAIDQREPRALHLHHHAMTAPEGVKDVRDWEFNLRNLARLEWFGLLKTAAKFAAKNVAAH